MSLNVINIYLFIYLFISVLWGVHDIQLYMIKFVSDLRQIGSFLRILGFPPPIKLTATIQLKYC